MYKTSIYVRIHIHMYFKHTCTYIHVRTYIYITKYNHTNMAEYTWNLKVQTTRIVLVCQNVGRGPETFLKYATLRRHM